MQIIERSSLGVRTAIWTLGSKSFAPQITLFPMIHVGESRFYLEVKDKLESFDFILFEGVQHNVTKHITRSYRLFPDKEKNGLIVQPRLNADHFSGELIHADISSDDFEYDWKELPLKTRLFWISYSTYSGIKTKLFSSSNKFYESTGMDLLPAQEEYFYNQVSEDLLSIIIEKRDKVLISVIDKVLNTERENPAKIAIVYGAAHMRAVLRHLILKLDFTVQDSEWMTIIE